MHIYSDIVTWVFVHSLQLRSKDQRLYKGWNR